MYDYVDGTPDGYDDQFKLWDCEMRSYGVGDEVPAVGGHRTYSVRLNSHEARGPRYVLVVEGRISSVGALEALKGAPVFGKWGGQEDEENPVQVALREAHR